MIMRYSNAINRTSKKYAHSLLESTGAFFASASLVMAFASGAGASESSMEFQAIGKRLIGTLSGSGTYSTDYPGVGKRVISSPASQLVAGLQVGRRSCVKVLQETPERGMACNSFIGTLPRKSCG